MVAQYGVVFLASMADILANTVEICFVYFTVTSTMLAAATSPTVSVKALVMPVAAPSFNKKLKTHPPKPYDIVQGMERVIDMMEETLQICERAQRSMQDALRRKTFPFGLRPSSDAYTHQVAKSIQIQSGRQESSDDLKIEPHARRDPLNIPCTYHTGARHTLRVCRLRKKTTRSVMLHAPCGPPRLRTSTSSRRPGSASLPTTKDPLGGASWWSRRTTHRESA
jgi:hypothetical protein